MAITYETKATGRAGAERVAVRLDGKRVGEIRPARGGGFVYQPLGGKVTGRVLRTVAEVKRSLEGES